MSKISVVIADDQGVMRGGLCSLVGDQSDMQVVGEAVNGGDAIEKAVKLRPDVLLMDIAMPIMNGIEATKRVAELSPTVRTILLTVHNDQEFFFSALKAGASGYVLKETQPYELLSAIRAVASGGSYLSPPVARAVVNDLIKYKSGEADRSLMALTVREREVLRLAASGQTNLQIANALYLSVRTVEKHRQSMMHKLGFKRREEMVKYALNKGLIEN